MSCFTILYTFEYTIYNIFFYTHPYTNLHSNANWDTNPNTNWNPNVNANPNTDIFLYNYINSNSNTVYYKITKWYTEWNPYTFAYQMPVYL